jgi:hypothetical protein
MAAIQADPAFESSRRSSRRRATTTGPHIAGRAISAVIALVCAAVGLFIARAYPLQPTIAFAVFVAWLAFAFLRFSIALPALIALVPVVGFANWTGWLTFEEIDMLILASAAGGYAAWAFARSVASEVSSGESRYAPLLSIFSIVLIALFLASTVVALERGLTAAGNLRFDFFQGYQEPLNSLRIFKSFAFAVLMTPLLLGELRKPDGFDRFGAGLTAALGLGALVVLQERLAFTGLLEFSDDYRVTGPFWEMHIGGAALDGFLALTIPFAVREAIRNASKVGFVAAMAVLGLATYACLVTFSRGVYVAIPISLFVLIALWSRHRLHLDRGALWLVLAKAVVFTICVAICAFVVFRGGGYRSVLAVFVTLGFAIPVDAALRRTSLMDWLAAAGIALLVAALGWMLASVLPKGPYLVFTLATVAICVTLTLDRPLPTRALATMTIATWLWLAFCATDIAGYWGGASAHRDSIGVMAVLALVVLGASRTARSVWPQQRREQLAMVGLVGLVFGAVAVFTAGAYMGSRFSSSRGDLDLRLRHWSDGLGRMHDLDWLIGKGLGRFPATSLFEAHDATSPGTYALVQRNGESFLSMTGPHMPYVGFEELLRVSQRVTLEPNTNYIVVARVRAPQKTGFHMEVCEKQLLYHAACQTTDPQLAAGMNAWHDLEFRFNSGAMGSSSWLTPKPVYFSVGLYDIGAVIEIKSLRMIGSNGVDALANTDFSERTAHWFSASDRYHLPWHIKNLALDVLFDQGAIGLALFALLVGAALLRTSLGRAHRHPDAPFVAAALVGYVVVGAFDSLLDVPRVAFVFYLVTMTGLMLRNPRAVVPTKVAAPPTAATPAVDEAAARAARRQRAFGERKPVSS